MVDLSNPLAGLATPRPDADDDADANEQNMRRHPLLPPPPTLPPPLVPLHPLARYRLSRRGNVLLGKNKKAEEGGEGSGKGREGRNERRNENRTIYPADYSRPPPTPLPAERPFRKMILVPRRKRARRHVSARQDFAKLCCCGGGGGSLSIRFLVVLRTNAKVYRSRLGGGGEEGLAFLPSFSVENTPVPHGMYISHLVSYHGRREEKGKKGKKRNVISKRLSSNVEGEGKEK